MAAHGKGLSMVELRCNNCPNLSNGFCTKLKVELSNGFAKLYYGGAIGVYYGNVTYPSKCGVKEEVKLVEELGIIVPNLDKEIMGQDPQT